MCKVIVTVGAAIWVQDAPVTASRSISRPCYFLIVLHGLWGLWALLCCVGMDVLDSQYSRCSLLRPQVLWHAGSTCHVSRDHKSLDLKSIKLISFYCWWQTSVATINKYTFGPQFSGFLDAIYTKLNRSCGKEHMWNNFECDRCCSGHYHATFARRYVQSKWTIV